MRKTALKLLPITLSVLLTACITDIGDQSCANPLTKSPSAEGHTAIKENKQVVTAQENNNKSIKTMSTIELSKTMFLEKVADYENNPGEFRYLGDKPCIIDFYATWCGPCRQTAPRLEEIAEKYGSKLYVYKVDVDQEQELAALFRVRSIPSILFIPMNGQPQMSVGAQGMPELEDAVKNILNINK